MNATLWTVNAIRDAVRATGSHWFDPGTMRCFGTVVLAPLYQGPGGIYFVTKDDDFEGKPSFNVRRFDPATASIDTVGEFCKIRDRLEAEEQAFTLARGEFAEFNVKQSDEGYRPISDAEQFLHDCRKHGKKTAGADDCESLTILGKQHHGYMEQRCNGVGPTDRTVDKCRKHIAIVAQHIGAESVVFSGDPRGCTVKLVWQDGETNDFGKEGWCVPGA